MLCLSVSCGNVEGQAFPDAGDHEDAALEDAGTDAGTDAGAGDDAGTQDDAGTGGDGDEGPECGNNVIEGFEACDDGNQEDGDECSADCRILKTERNLGISGVAYDITKDNNGTVHIIWKVGGNLRYGQIEDGLVVGAEDIPNSSNVNTRYNRPRIAVRPDGATVHTAWNGTPGETLFHAWRDSEGNWHREAAWNRGTSSYYVACPSIGVDLTGAVHIVAQRWDGDNDGAPTPVVYCHKPSGGSWSGLVIVQQPDPPENRQWRDTSMFTDKLGGIHAVWKAGTGVPGKYRYTPSGGDLGQEPTQVIPVPDVPQIDNVSFGDLFVTENGDVHHSHMTYPLQQIWYQVKRDESTSFAEAALAGPMNNDEHVSYENPWPVIAVDTHDRVFTAWAENRGGAPIPFVVLAVSGSTPWAIEDLTTTANIDGSSAPAMTAVGDLIYLVYRNAAGELILVNTRYAP
ncbi:MAG: hypothetical protein JRF33_04595 [Deltaproteobacteria bacterium]|nr:hypothetical protein [Deltaproteobacteria bacterium]